jgi:T5orf172 domain
MSEIDLDELRSELSDFAEPEKKGGRSPREERIIAGFEEIQRFVEKHGRLPRHSEGLDIFERLYAVRLDRLRALAECRSLLAPLDHQGLLSDGEIVLDASPDTIDDEELLAELKDIPGAGSVTELRHVRKSVDKRAAEEIANRAVCEDFETFKPLFEKVQRELQSGVRESIPVQTMDQIKMAEIQQGQYFIVGGQVAYVAEVGEDFKTGYDRRDSRLRVVYDNGTESNILMRSFQRSLYPDKEQAGRIITNPDAGPLFADEHDADDLASGTIYVLRSKSDNPIVAAHREVLHKIGVTGGKIGTRVANASLDPTFLMAEVEVVATYVLYNVNRVKLENLIHRVFDPAQLDIEIKDRFGNPIKPREWFLVPLFVVDEAVKRIKDGSITQFVYDPMAARLVKTGLANV